MRLDESAAWPIDAYLIASPYYTRVHLHGPSRAVLFTPIFNARCRPRRWPIVLYNST